MYSSSVGFINAHAAKLSKIRERDPPLLQALKCFGCGVADGQKLVSYPLHTHNTYARRASPTSHKIGDPSDSEITETPGHNRNSRVGVLGTLLIPISYSTCCAGGSSSAREAERDVKLGKKVSYAVSKPFPDPSHELFRRLQGSSSIDELIAALEKEIVGGPHPAVGAGEQQADAFAARARAGLLEHELRETMKRVSRFEESEKTASALVRLLKEQVAQRENRNISLQELHQSTNLERDSWSTERIRLDATIRDKERIIASMSADYHRDAGNRQLVLGRCYELTVQIRQLSDAVAMGQPMPGLTAAELSAFRSASETLRQAGLGIFGDRGGRNPPQATPAAPVTPALPSPRRLQVSPTSQASYRLARSSSDDFGRRHARSPSVFRSSVHPRSLSVSARGSQSAPSSPTRNTIVRRPRSPSVARSGSKRRHSPDSDADSSGSALMSGHASSRSSTSSRSRKKARATPTTSPVSSKKSSSRQSANKMAAKSRSTVSHSPSEDSDDEAGLAPLRRPRRTAAANCSAIQQLLHAGDSDSDSEMFGEAAAVSSSSGHGGQASSGSTTISSTSAPPPSSHVTSASPTQASQDSIVDLAPVNSPVSLSALAEDLEGADSSGVESSSTTKQTEAALTLASLSGPTKSVVIRALPPGKHPAWSPGDSDSDGGDSTVGGSTATPFNSSNKLVESSESSGDESTLPDPSKSQTGSGAGSGSPPLVSPTVAVRPPQVTTSDPVSAAAKAPAPPKTPPPARSSPKPAAKAKPTDAIRPAKDGSKPKSASKPSAGKAKLTASDIKARAKSDGGVPLHHVDVKVLVARAAATTELVDGLGEDDRFDFDEELLPEDSWEPEAGDDEYVVEAILDDRWPISTGTERNQREFYVKWRGYDDPTWEPVSNLSCGGLLFDYLLQRKRENRLPTKVSNHARYPSVMGTGHRAWEKATVPHDDLGEGGHRPSPRVLRQQMHVLI
ncbi:unnamed protein product [Phytophthora fragariaefolia]|uniref:Unnamed protein product n=1 Tax=Phytophthora fragariaefolia TaxID=1490495 RepID=A0A9W6TQA6_9STRA|nr:unnamed protein product [Phytophthora fragariaefolia]